MPEGAQEKGKFELRPQGNAPARLGREHGGGAPLCSMFGRKPLRRKMQREPLPKPTLLPWSGLLSAASVDTLDNGGPCGMLPFPPKPTQDVLQHLRASDWRASDELHSGLGWPWHARSGYLDNEVPANSCVDALCSSPLPVFGWCCGACSQLLVEAKDAGNGWGGPTGVAGLDGGCRGLAGTGGSPPGQASGGTGGRRRAQACQQTMNGVSRLQRLVAIDGRRQQSGGSMEVRIGSAGEGRGAGWPRGACLVLPCCHVAVKHSRIGPARSEGAATDGGRLSRLPAMLPARLSAMFCRHHSAWPQQRQVMRTPRCEPCR